MATTLNLDVLTQIPWFCARTTVLALMQASRIFRSECAKWLLAEEVILKDFSQLDSFLLFINADGRRRYRFLHAPRLLLLCPPLSVSKRFLDSIPYMTNLRSLAIPNHSGQLLEIDPPLASAFSSLQSLRSIQLGITGPNGLSLLQTSRAEVRTLNLDVYVYDSFHDPVTALQHLGPTLEEMRCSTWPVGQAVVTRALYPRMRKFEIECWSLLYISQLIHAFPNLAHLSVTTASSTRLTDVQSVLHHSRNVEDQISGGTWQVLERFTGNPRDLYLLGICCPIRELSLVAINQEVLRFLYPALTRARPTELKLSLSPEALLNDEAFIAAMHQDAFSGLRSLSLEVTFVQIDYLDADLQAIFANFLSAVREMHISRLTFKFVPGPSWSVYCLNFIYGIATRHESMLRAFCHHVVDQVPSLEILELSGVRLPGTDGVKARLERMSNGPSHYVYTAPT
ncbi:hypothetical protein OH77DRAFT_732959 [Trametes cingulata]|nr:hypothetical protein OH77DRAFT_732959 [Trametes cingulata]